MKNKITTLNTVIAVLIAVFLSSCTSLKTNDFTAQKYTHFKKGKNRIDLPHTDPATSEQACTHIPALNCRQIESPVLTTPAIEKISNTSVPVIEMPVKIYKAVAKAAENINKPVHRNEIKSFLAQRFFEKPNTASTNDSNDVELLLLVILALILPPLAVLLARGAGSEFLLSIILTILFWVPGQIYALLVVFDII